MAVVPADNFEDGDISEYGGDTGVCSIEDYRVKHGTYSLWYKNAGTGSNSAITKTDVTYSEGDTIEYFTYIANDSPVARFYFGVQSETGYSNISGYEVNFQADWNDLTLRRFDNGERNGLKLVDAYIPTETWIRCEVEWKIKPDDMKVTIWNNSTGEKLGTNEYGYATEYTSGGIGYGNYSSNVYYDAKVGPPLQPQNLTVS
jgi:hypothetical protein